ncbi:thioesterase [Streptomyces alkaliphilus]|uniref:Thioesterase n=1 Tax=Streptomyces alkaliphilus TaxID=1472722 RepID=A0A7W3TEH0_9ACTN|nr:thioesterase [Streptomyces alkaliphilus]MBB0245180.1 thioesterase [Streptomyces alkaliphilus]
MTPPRLVDRASVTAWFPFAEPPGAIGVRLYCLPHAGGSASAFRSWFGRVGEVSVRPVQLPGRETRLREPAYRSMTDLVRDLTDALLADLETPDGHRPFAIYGHSLGGQEGFEVVRELRRRGGPTPLHLFVSGCPAPGDDPNAHEPPVGSMSDEQVVALLRRIGGTPEWMLRDPSVLRMILPPFRGDFAVRESHEHRPEPPLTLPITALAADRDPRAGIRDMVGWRRETTGPFRCRVLSGGHFAVLEQAEVTRRRLAEGLREVMA